MSHFNRITRLLEPEGLRSRLAGRSKVVCLFLLLVGEVEVGDSISVGSASSFGKMRRNLLYQGHGNKVDGNSVGNFIKVELVHIMRG
ncbi:hypothetical protein V6N12_014272 [Hibiscus sabdariffa]|uniref:Uncharacterized protein n=1 Tax=Hibiscus sabdariffa TaxID=183260 RepID=A0ABR2DJP5_9ROSI